VDFTDTKYGARFFDKQFPDLIKQLTRIADGLDAQKVMDELAEESAAYVPALHRQLDALAARNEAHDDEGLRDYTDREAEVAAQVGLTPAQTAFIENQDGIAEHHSSDVCQQEDETWALCWVRVPEK
jgi:hypothetical protein